jgi:pimeloyl-ACP methyl ester carboxylesterase
MSLKGLRGIGLLAAGLLAIATGCRAAEPQTGSVGLGALFHPLEEPAAVATPPCPEALKDHVYIFAVNGVDPLCVANFNGLCDYLRSHGYRNTHFGRLTTCHGFASQIQQVRWNDPGARIVLIGYSYGCNHVRAIANTLQQQAIRVDLLVYIAGDLIQEEPRSRPENVGRILNIRAQGMTTLGGDRFFNRDDIGGAHNVRLGYRHFVAPSRSETLELVLQELTAVTLASSQSSPTPVPPEGIRVRK